MDDTREYQDFSVLDRPWTTVFYSFRGGVGRTTLAVSSALGLTRLGKPVGLIDFDLEAPGFGAFACLKAPSEQQGLVEYIDTYRGREIAPAIGPYVFKAAHAPVPVEAADKDSRAEPLDAPLVVMRAGRSDAAYRQVLSRLDWSDLYRLEQGRELLENLRLGFRFDEQCRHLIADSRTGITEIGGACVGHLADAVVLVFEPHFGHIAGLKSVVASIKERERIEGRVIPRLYVASRVPTNRARELDEDVRANAAAIYESIEGRSLFWRDERGCLEVNQFDRWNLLRKMRGECCDQLDLPLVDPGTPYLAYVGDYNFHDLWQDSQLCYPFPTIEADNEISPRETDYALVCSWVELIRQRAVADVAQSYIAEDWSLFCARAREIQDDDAFERELNGFLRRQWADVRDRYQLSDEHRPIEFVFERLVETHPDYGNSGNWRHPRREIMKSAIRSLIADIGDNSSRRRGPVEPAE